MEEQLAEHLSFLPEWAVGPAMALIIVVVGYIIARIAAAVVSGAINRTGIGKRAQTTGGNIGRSLSKAVFWVLWLYFILIGLEQMPQVHEALGPVQGMFDNVFAYVPQLLIGGLVLAIGVALARVVKNALTSTLEAAQVDRLANRFDFAGADEASTSNSIARSLGGLASAIVIITFAIAAIGIWDIPGFSDEVTNMLGTILGYIPNIAGAAVILAIAIFIARFASNLAQNTLPALGIDDSLKSLGGLDGETDRRVVPSRIIATVTFIGIVLMGLTAAMKALGIPELTNVFNTLLEVGGRVVLGSIIIGAGLFIANFVSRLVTETSGDLAGTIIKYATIIIITFMGLETMQLGEDIVSTAFTAAVWAAAVAGGLGGAIAFGMGGREWAAKKLQQWWPSKTTTRRK